MPATRLTTAALSRSQYHQSSFIQSGW